MRHWIAWIAGAALLASLGGCANILGFEDFNGPDDGGLDSTGSFSDAPPTGDAPSDGRADAADAGDSGDATSRDGGDASIADSDAAGGDALDAFPLGDVVVDVQLNNVMDAADADATLLPDGSPADATIDVTTPDSTIGSDGCATPCSGKCPNLESDILNCGTCGHSCGSGQTCLNGSCLQSCTPGTSQCSGNSLQTCAATSTWGSAVACPADETCTAAGGTASCACTASLCAQSGTVCQDSQTLATCSLDQNKCLVVSATAPCPVGDLCGGKAPGASCSPNCQSTCDAGQAQCVGGALATCAAVGSCWVYPAATACGTRQTCTGAAGSAKCECNVDPVCTSSKAVCSGSTAVSCQEDSNGCFYELSSLACVGATPVCLNGSCVACTPSTTQCSGSGVQTCSTAGQWESPVACPANETCTTSGTTASCTCLSSICTAAGTICENSQTVATCSVDSNKCKYLSSTTPCTATQSCAVDAGTAYCSNICQDTCKGGQTSCVGGGLATCTLINGCYGYGTPEPCGLRQTCTGTTGSAACTCNVDPICKSLGNVCSQSTAVVCAEDANGCFYETTSSSCVGETPVCLKGACVACTPGSTQCSGNGVQTCSAAGQWETAVACAAHQTCTTSGGVASCTCMASICTAKGTTCQDSQTVATCLVDSNNCPYVSTTTTCAAPNECSGTAPSATCSPICQSSCAQGQTTCATGGVEFCQESPPPKNCWSYATPPTPCGIRQTCTGAAGAGQCVCIPDTTCTSVGSICVGGSAVSCAADANGCIYKASSAPCGGAEPVCLNGVCEACTPGATQCTASGLETCSTGGQWSSPVACGTNQSCVTTGGNGKCACNASICTAAGTTCQGTSEVATCAVDGQGCPYVSATTTCVLPEVCTGAAPTSACGLTCKNQCTAGATECTSSTVLATCAVNSATGCTDYTTVSTQCPEDQGIAVHRACTGAAGTASCTCVADPPCSAAGNICTAGNTTVTDCAADSAGCIYVASQTVCSTATPATPVCVSGACETCTPGTTQCTDPTDFATCVAPGVWGPSTACSTNPCQVYSCTTSDAGTGGGTCVLSSIVADGTSCSATNAGMVCASGMCGCTAPGWTLCNGTCIPDTSDPNNCGGCNIQCGNADGGGPPSCVGGACQ